MLCHKQDGISPVDSGGFRFSETSKKQINTFIQEYKNVQFGHIWLSQSHLHPANTMIREVLCLEEYDVGSQLFMIRNTCKTLYSLILRYTTLITCSPIQREQNYKKYKKKTKTKLQKLHKRSEVNLSTFIYKSVS